MRTVWMLVVAVGLLFRAVDGRAELSLPDAPVPQTAGTAAQTSASQGAKAKAEADVPVPVAGDSLFAPIALGRGPESLKTKTASYVVATFGPRAFVAPAFSAAITMARAPKGYPREWLDGGGAFGRNYGAALGSRVALETGRYAAGALLHEDFRYRPAKEKGAARLFHAIGYTFVDQSDSGHRTLAIANFVGAAAGGFAGNLYLPDGFNTPGDGARRFATRMGGFAATNVTREFAPEIFAAFHALHLPFPHIPVPGWWTKRKPASRP